MNDRLAFMKTNVRVSYSKLNFHYNFFSSNSCNLATATDRKKNNCPFGYFICKYANGGLTFIKTKMTFDQAKIQCQNLNSTICKTSPD